MGRNIIKQPNGLYAQWSTIVDDLITWNMTKEELIQWRIDEAAEGIREDVEIYIKSIELNTPKYSWWKTWDDVSGKMKKMVLRENK